MPTQSTTNQTITRHAHHTAYTDPGAFAALFDGVPTDLEALAH